MQHGITPLHAASASGKVEAAKALLRCRVDLNKQDRVSNLNDSQIYSRQLSTNAAYILALTL